MQECCGKETQHGSRVLLVVARKTGSPGLPEPGVGGEHFAEFFYFGVTFVIFAGFIEQFAQKQPGFQKIGMTVQAALQDINRLAVPVFFHQQFGKRQKNL